MAWTLDDCARIDMRDWTRERVLEDGGRSAQLNAGRGVRVEVDINPDRVLLSWGGSSQEVTLAHTACNFGGVRAWFLCPRCRRRVQVLYLKVGRWTCHRCTRLIYGCQAESTLLRLMRRAQKIRRKLGGHPSLALPFPVRPGRMRSLTYIRLRRQGEALEAQIHDGMLASAFDVQAFLDRLRRKTQPTANSHNNHRLQPHVTAAIPEPPHETGANDEMA